MKSLGILLMCLLLAACGDYTIEHRDTGYRGKAKLDAYLAAARFLEDFGYDVVSKPGWPKLDQDATMLIVPAEVISTEAYKREVDRWVSEGGHLLCLVEWGESYHDEWRGGGGFSGEEDEVVPKALGDWLKDAGLEVGKHAGDKLKAERLRVGGKRYEIFAESSVGISEGGDSQRIFSQVEYGQGLITVMADARPFRNRHIGDYDHASLLLSLAEASPYKGTVVIVRDAGISLWTLVWGRGWPVVLGLIAMTLFWLWKNMPSFGPQRREQERSTVRDYDHHLEALGDFQWRLDKGAAMLRPLRDSVLERAQRMASTSHHGADLFEWIAQRASMTRERAERAMTNDRPADPASFTRVLADLQKIHLSLT